MDTLSDKCTVCVTSADLTGLRPLKATRVAKIGDVGEPLCSAHSAEIKHWAMIYRLPLEMAPARAQSKAR